MLMRTVGLFLLGACAGAATLLTEPAPAQAGPCFDRCKTRCHLPMGYRICRDDCSHACKWRRRY